MTGESCTWEEQNDLDIQEVKQHRNRIDPSASGDNWSGPETDSYGSYSALAQETCRAGDENRQPRKQHRWRRNKMSAKVCEETSVKSHHPVTAREVCAVCQQTPAVESHHPVKEVCAVCQQMSVSKGEEEELTAGLHGDLDHNKLRKIPSSHLQTPQTTRLLPDTSDDRHDSQRFPLAWTQKPTYRTPWQKHVLPDDRVSQQDSQQLSTSDEVLLRIWRSSLEREGRAGRWTDGDFSGSSSSHENMFSRSRRAGRSSLELELESQTRTRKYTERRTAVGDLVLQQDRSLRVVNALGDRRTVNNSSSSGGRRAVSERSSGYPSSPPRPPSPRLPSRQGWKKKVRHASNSSTKSCPELTTPPRYYKVWELPELDPAYQYPFYPLCEDPLGLWADAQPVKFKHFNHVQM